MENLKLLPCPCCGNEYPFEHITWNCCVLRCKCGLEMYNASVRTVYDSLEEVPEEIREYAHPATGLKFKTDTGVQSFAEHGKYGVSCVIAFFHAGFAQKWNTRA